MTEEANDKDQPAAVAGAVASMRIMVDNTVRVTIDFEPKDREAVMRIMGMVGRPVAVAALRDGFAKASDEPTPERKKLGPLCQQAIDLCISHKFHEFIKTKGPWKASEEAAKGFILGICGVTSRRDIDTNIDAARRFDEMKREFTQWRYAPERNPSWRGGK